MKAASKSFLKIGLVGTVAAAAGWIAFSEFRGLMGGRDTHNHVWFYDESERKLYAMHDTTMPPDKGIGGPSGDGERAIVVGFGKDKHDRGEWRVAYLQKYTPELKKLLDESILARAAGRIFDGTIPPRTSAYFQTNTLVKRVDDPDWHTANSPEGRLIVKEWRSWHGADGSGPVVCPAD